ncbi:two-component system, chemotaxis family, response regulator CheY [Neorhodopirellula lusitana]|uniref:Two-component system, chemotaxis family, response regulator CheY n=1 Tax=Neorhodopirellula lusitana TaxID=445327 RepID=A0ABY1Q9G4_9BACT|nr:response regulator [Neorhodopirellula lusitana]SMP61496.1 two-component system, chemotaxis family, response regulator CheY [Neorhodopirellula lusitana]
MKFNFNITNTDSNRKATILVVDDSAMVRYLIETTLASAGFCTRSASDGEAAIAAMRHEKFQAIVTDLEMPRVTGAELIKRVRNHSDPTIYKLPILVVSHVTDKIERARLRFLGADLFLPKPIDTRTLIATTNRLVTAA